MDYSRPELADRLAAEYVSGVLRGGARRRLENLLPAHAVLNRAVRDWQHRLMPLTLAVEPQQPSASVWRRIEERLDGAARGVADGAAQIRDSGRRALAFWRGFSTIAALATVALAVVLAVPAPVHPPIVVVLSAAQPAPGAPAGAIAPASFVASITADGRAMVTKPLIDVNLQADRSLELWSLPPSGAPRSLGVIAPDKATVVQRGKVLEGTDAFAVTLEPAGGSPSGKPTGPVLYLGKLTL